MSYSLAISVFKPIDEITFFSSLSRLCSSAGGKFQPNSDDVEIGCDCRTANYGGVVSLYVQYPSKEIHEVLRKFSKIHGCAFLSCGAQESAGWEYQLYNKGELVDQFCVSPEFWNPDDPEWAAERKGNPTILAKVWEIPKERIDQYIKDWQYEEKSDEGFFRLKGKAYPEDRRGYGDWE